MRLSPNSQPIAEAESTRRPYIALAVAIFLLAFSVRVLTWHDTRLEVGKVQSGVTADYQRVARLLRADGLKSFFSSSSPLADLNNMGHPPGYPILIAVFHESQTAVQFVQIIGDALAAVLIFLIVAEILPLSAGVIAGSFAALSPQFAWNSVLLLPDSISVLPILLAAYLIAQATKKPAVILFFFAGALIGVSCWLRANAMLLTLFFAGAVPLLIKSKTQSASKMLADRRPDVGATRRFALAVVCGTLLLVLPLTIRNAIVFHRFIPISLGAGQTLLEGIADYDPQGNLGIPRTDLGIMQAEAATYQRPDYAHALFAPDGVERDRARLSRGLAVVRSHPIWFGSIMMRRAASMVKLERAQLVSTMPAITHALNSPVQELNLNPRDLIRSAVVMSPDAKVSIASDERELTVLGDNSPYGNQVSWPVKVKAQTDYVLEFPVRVDRGRMRFSVIGNNGEVLSSSVLQWLESKDEPPLDTVQLSFVTDGTESLRISNEAWFPTAVRIGPVKLSELGPARFLWTRYPRFLIHAIQKTFLTAVMLPLAVAGVLFLALKKEIRALVVLSIVPMYFFTVQSVVHTEYRYVLAVDYSLFAFAAFAVSQIVAFVIVKSRSSGQALPLSIG